MVSYAYVRGSSTEQNPERQVEAIRNYCPDIPPGNIFLDKQSGRTFERPRYQAMKGAIENVAEALRGIETIQLIVEEVDRLGRNAAQVKEELAWFQRLGVVVRILELPTTLANASGENGWVLEMVSNILVEVYSAMAEQENEKRAKRQREGIALAKARGVYQGRKPVAIDRNAFERVYSRWKAGECTARKAMDMLGMKRSTFYRHVKQFEENGGQGKGWKNGKEEVPTPPKK